jgi:ribosome-associated translation inhibitor RaiA
VLLSTPSEHKYARRKDEAINQQALLTATMRLNLQHLNLRSLDTLDSWVEKQILALGQARQIDEANVRLVRLENSSPAYQVNVHLVTPGPDVFAESRDHTLRAAFAKAMKRLRDKLAGRASKQVQRIKSNIKARRGG